LDPERMDLIAGFMETYLALTATAIQTVGEDSLNRVKTVFPGARLPEPRIFPLFDVRGIHVCVYYNT